MIKIKKLTQLDISEPVRSTPGAAGYDLHAAITEDVRIWPGEVAMVPTGYAWQIPAGYVGFLVPRSGKATREGMSLANTVGVLDQDFTGQVMAAVRNYGGELLVIEPGERFCQLVIVPCLQEPLCVVSELSETARGDGGFGSTDKLTGEQKYERSRAFCPYYDDGSRKPLWEDLGMVQRSVWEGKFSEQ